MKGLDFYVIYNFLGVVYYGPNSQETVNKSKVCAPEFAQVSGGYIGTSTPKRQIFIRLTSDDLERNDINIVL